MAERGQRVLVVDFTRQAASLDGEQLALTPLEFRLLAAFVRHAGETLSPAQLMETVWNDYTGMTTDPVKVYVGTCGASSATRATGWRPSEASATASSRRRIAARREKFLVET